MMHRLAKKENLHTRLSSTTGVSITTVQDKTNRYHTDELATEEPMEVRIVAWKNTRRVNHSVAITMRTPGHDFELALGFLFTEGVIANHYSIDRIDYCADPDEPQPYNIVNVYLKRGVEFDSKKLSRHVYTSSSCGVCGKASLELICNSQPQIPVGDFQLPYSYFFTLPKKLQHEQTIFSRTGGLHASALFDTTGNLLQLNEDVGRHNALDKLIGTLLLKNRLPASNTILLVSGRASFELVQKAAMAGIPVLAAIGAPSSLAVELAKEIGMTIVGFLREQRFNVYTGSKRINLK